VKNESTIAICGVVVGILALLAGVFQKETREFACGSLHLFCAGVHIVGYDAWEDDFTGQPLPINPHFGNFPLSCRDSLVSSEMVGAQFFGGSVFSRAPNLNLPNRPTALTAPASIGLWSVHRYLVWFLSLNFKRGTTDTLTVESTLQTPISADGRDHESGSFTIDTGGNSTCEISAPLLNLAYGRPGDYTLQVSVRGLQIEPVSKSYSFTVTP
jgi:hypothetical protein